MGATLCCDAWVSHSSFFSCCGARALGHTSFSIWGTWLHSFSSRVLECRLSSCGTWAKLLHGVWDLPGPGIKKRVPYVGRQILIPYHQRSLIGDFWTSDYLQMRSCSQLADLGQSQRLAGPCRSEAGVGTECVKLECENALASGFSLVYIYIQVVGKQGVKLSCCYIWFFKKSQTHI